MSEKQRVLLIDDDSDAIVALARTLKASGLTADVQATSSISKALEIASRDKPDVAVLDLSLEASRGVESGFEVLEQLLKLSPFCRVIVLTGHATTNHGIQSLHRGAAHFLEKPANLPHLLALIHDGIQQSNLRREYARLSQSGPDNLEKLIVGKSDHIQQVRRSILYAAQTSLSVLITGDTGTGKGLCAQALHRFSSRKAQRFVRYQPTFGNADLVGSQLFGHRKGAFTGASEERRGLMSEAHQGTLFLDEIDELPQETQIGLLGVLQDKKFRALGTNVEEEANFRLICACNGDVDRSLEMGKLRRDFFHRVAHYRIHLEPLKNRREDIPPLVDAALTQLREKEMLNVFTCSSDTLSALMKLELPGNVRELESVVTAAAYRAHIRGQTQIEIEDLAYHPRSTKPDLVRYHDQVDSYKLRLIREALERHSGNQLKASEELGLDRSTMRRLLARASCT